MNEMSILNFLLSVGYALVSEGAKVSPLPPAGVKLDLGPLSIDWKVNGTDFTGHVTYSEMRYVIFTYESLLRLLAMAIRELRAGGVDDAKKWNAQIRVLAVWVGQFAKPSDFDYDGQEAFKAFGIATAPFMLAGDPTLKALHQNDFGLTVDETNKALEGCFM